MIESNRISRNSLDRESIIATLDINVVSAGAVPYGLCKVPRLVYFNAEEGNDLEGTVVTCDAPHGPHAEEENREHCKNQLRESGFCVNMPAHGLHDEL